jgi:DNA-binding NtrC family response regulator
MAARVLIALAEDPGALASALRAAGFALEICQPTGLRAAVASVGPDACVIASSGRLPADVAELLELPDRPALVALVDATDDAAATAAHERGYDAVAPRDASAAWIAAALRDALARRALLAELARRRAEQLGSDELAVLGSSQAARRLRDALQRVAGTPRTTVLITGERQSGLDCVARLVHARSARAAGPLAELRASASSDAQQARLLSDGVAALARGGTLIVHEVGAAGPELQSALANVLEDEAASSSGADVRVVATSSTDLSREVQAGRFGEDLLYKLNVLALAVPPFGERRADVAEIAQRAAERLRNSGRPAPALDRAALAAISQRAWPGGLSELIAAIELGAPTVAAGSHASIAAESFLSAQAVAVGSATPAPIRSLRSAEESLIRQVLAETGGNKLRSAEILGIHRTTLYHKLREYGIEA